MKVSIDALDLEKARFVINELSSLLLKINPSISKLEYILDSKTNEEYIKVNFKNGDVLGKCITGDSLGTLTMEILKALGFFCI